IRTALDNYQKTSWVLKDDDGQEHILNNCGSLAHKFKYAKIGQVLLVKYKGTERIKLKKFGVKDVHQFKLFCLSDEAASVDDIEDEEDGEIDDTVETDLIDVLDFGDEDEDDDSLSLDILDA
ncbi:unnamed protein product, partial [marine sediment metagenome]